MTGHDRPESLVTIDRNTQSTKAHGENLTRTLLHSNFSSPREPRMQMAVRFSFR
jgi:hypothetical protein